MQGVVDSLGGGQRHCVPGRGLFQGLGIGVGQVQILHALGGGEGSKGSREQGLLRVHFGVETPGLFRFASTGAVPVIQTKESIIGKASSFFMIIIS